MTNQKINDIDIITTFSGTDRLLVNTDVVNNVLEQIEKDDFVADIVSTDTNNLIEIGTDNKLFSELPTTVTTQGNTFNGNSQLIQTTSTGKYPALDGSLITNITADLPIAITSNMPTIANNVSDANNDIDFSSGFCWDLTTNAKIISTAMTKQLDTIWASGSEAGGLDTGTKSVSTWYYCYAISKSDGTADFLFSASATSPTMPSGYVNKRRIGSIKTNSSGNIIGFIQRSDIFYYKTAILDVSVTNISTTPSNYILSVPPISGVSAIFSCYLAAASAISQSIYFYSPLSSAQTADYTQGRIYNINASAIYARGAGQIEILTDNATITAVVDTGTGSANVSTIGYKDTRGVK